MGTGYVTLMYDPEEIVSEGIGDVAACRYDGVEVGLPKLEDVGRERFGALLEEYDLDLYCVMSGWLNGEEEVAAAVEGAPMAAALGAEFLGLLPPPRGVVDDETFHGWLERICTAAGDAGLTPALHHHAGAKVESPAEIRRWLDEGPDEMALLFDTAHYYAYGENYPAGDVTDGVERFADDIVYVHLKDIDPPSDFDDHVRNMSAGKLDYDSIVTYLGAFTDLGEGVVDLPGVLRALADVGYEGHLTIEMENQRMPRLMHAKQNVDYLRSIEGE